MNSNYRVLQEFPPFANFREASRPVLNALYERVGFDLWMVTRTKNDDWIVLVAEDHGYGIRDDDDVFCWSDSFCCRMVKGLGPSIAPRVADVPAYSCAPIARQVPIGAYIGIPLVYSDGSLFGTLCAINPEPRPDSIMDEIEFIGLNARLLSTLINMELDGEDISAQLNRERRLSCLDKLTGVSNRRGWDNLSRIEEARCLRYKTSASIMIIDLDDFKAVNDKLGHAEGDKILQKTASCIEAAVRPFDIVSRIGGDEFALMVIESNVDLIDRIKERIRTRLSDEGIKASIGWSVIRRGVSFDYAMREADDRMYVEKRYRKLQDSRGDFTN